MELRVLGPVEAYEHDVAVTLGGTRPRTVIAALALAEGVVSAGRLIEEVWRGAPPPTATATLQSYISRLRRALGRDRLVTRPAGYALLMDDDELDVSRFATSLRSARAARDAGNLAVAIDAYEAALDVWRGDVAADLDPGPVIRENATRLVEDRLLAVEERIEVLLSAGRHHEVVSDLETLTFTHPHRERLHAQRIIALYRAGRQGDALEAYRRARERLVASLGVEPGPQLRELHQRVLDQDPRLGINATGGVPDVAVVASESVSAEQVGADTVLRIGNLPAPLGTFVGRVAARRDIAARLAGDVRLLTLVGAGGCGKTQLALRVAADAGDGYADGTWWVELAAHRTADLVVRAAADAVGLAVTHTGDHLDRLAERLGQGRQLLVLDNCEHLIDACADLVTELLRRCPQLRILTTSREPLDVEGEQTWRVPSLQLPPAEAGPEDVLTSEAAELLLLRAREVAPDLTVAAADVAAIARICSDLDGIPLALELAAARLRVLSIEELAERLEDRLGALAQGRRSAPARHRTLEAAIGWSYDLLDAAERQLLGRLTVFAGGATLPDVEAVCAPDSAGRRDVVDLLAALVDKSLVQRTADPDGRTRLSLLATVQSFLEARQDAAEHRSMVERHVEHYAALTEHAAPRLTGPEQVAWLNRLHADQDNLRLVLDRDDLHSARVAASVWWFWLQFGHVVEGDRRVQTALDADADQPIPLRHGLQRGAARLAAAVDQIERAREHLAEARMLGATLERADHLAQDHAFEARLAAQTGDVEVARDRLVEARDLAIDAAEPWTSAAVEHHAAVVAWHLEEPDVAARAAAAAETGFQDAGDRWSACLARLDAARIARHRGRSGDAARLHRTNLRVGLELTVSSLDFVGLPQDLQDLAVIALDSEQPELAATLLGAAAALRTAVELPGSTGVRHEELVKKARSGLTSSVFDAAFDRGRAGTAEQAIGLALELAAPLG